MKLVADQSQRAAEKEILEGLGFTVIEVTLATFAQAPHPALQSVWSHVAIILTAL